MPNKLRYQNLKSLEMTRITPLYRYLSHVLIFITILLCGWIIIHCCYYR